MLKGTVGAIRQPLVIVGLAMAVLLLVVVANVGTLFLVRHEGDDRTDEGRFG